MIHLPVDVTLARPLSRPGPLLEWSWRNVADVSWLRSKEIATKLRR